MIKPLLQFFVSCATTCTTGRSSLAHRIIESRRHARSAQEGTIKKHLRAFTDGNSAVPFGLKKQIQIHAGRHPALFFGLYRLARKQRARAISPETQLVIEGFPRSANSFSVGAFRQAQREEVRVAHNLHVPAQVIQAARWRIPSLVLLRKPKDAVLSLVMRDPISVDQALKYYISFYETAAKYRDSFVLGLFEEVTDDFGAVIERVNARFGTEFSLFYSNEENVNRVFTRIEGTYRKRFGETASLENKISRPSSSREKMKRGVEYESESPRRKRLISEAEAVYDRLAGRTPELASR